MSSLDLMNGSLRVRNGTHGKDQNFSKKMEVKGCPSVMSPETKRLLPPNTETVQTKPFPIRELLRTQELQPNFPQICSNPTFARLEVGQDDSTVIDFISVIHSSMG
ncbi:hypothetical protein HHI36_007497 [Cryptolaemus montrouzieri]|uniref:Uncharacterized protein n=1 Tax=Cryptolaemus montrouzieri TaxID=559131 RepID=A0ABD2MPP7_9CUCU